MFRDRDDAAERLAQRLSPLRGTRPLVCAIPRGAVPMARRIADALGGDLDVVLTRKLAAPGQPEFAIGAVDENGWSYVAPCASVIGATPIYVEREIERQVALMRERRAHYTPVRSRVDPAGRVVIVVDDGLATGATMIAALHALRAQSPARLVCAVPVASAEAIDKVTGYADEVVCLEVPADFQAVGQFYGDFRQVDDEEVLRLLAGAGDARSAQPGAAMP